MKLNVGGGTPIKRKWYLDNKLPLSYLGERCICSKGKYEEHKTRLKGQFSNYNMESTYVTFGS